MAEHDQSESLAKLVNLIELQEEYHRGMSEMLKDLRRKVALIPLQNAFSKNAKSEAIAKALAMRSGNRKLAAYDLGISERTLYRFLKQEHGQGQLQEG